MLENERHYWEQRSLWWYHNKNLPVWVVQGMVTLATSKTLLMVQFTFRHHFLSFKDFALASWTSIGIISILDHRLWCTWFQLWIFNKVFLQTRSTINWSLTIKYIIQSIGHWIITAWTSETFTLKRSLTCHTLFIINLLSITKIISYEQFHHVCHNFFVVNLSPIKKTKRSPNQKSISYSCRFLFFPKLVPPPMRL